MRIELEDMDNDDDEADEAFLFGGMGARAVVSCFARGEHEPKVVFEEVAAVLLLPLALVLVLLHAVVGFLRWWLLLLESLDPDELILLRP